MKVIFFNLMIIAYLQSSYKIRLSKKIFFSLQTHTQVLTMKIDQLLPPAYFLSLFCSENAI